MGFVDSEVDSLLGLEKEKEVAVVVAHIGVVLGEKVERPRNSVPPIALRLESLSKGEVAYSEIWRANAASAFNSPAQVRTWRESFSIRTPEVNDSQTSIPLSSAVGGFSKSPPLETVILLGVQLGDSPGYYPLRGTIPLWPLHPDANGHQNYSSGQKGDRDDDNKRVCRFAPYSQIE